ncbi:MAG: tryptophan--tRNA ligase [Rickettsiales bacterium]|jgi:tryptophanyl-tRNA synthetase|nr:tryptophan--tRNA ligase [Rickettsiales bacterium]
MDSFEKAEEISRKIVDDISRGVGKYRILTGDRPTGNLHLGHYFGSLVNRINLQKVGVELFILVADQQVLTDHDSFDRISSLTKELVIDNISVGINFEDEKAFIFPHSNVPELNQLLVPFLTLVSVAELERNPTVKEEIKSANITNISAGMLVYPVHQACDILSVNANLVPVGKDQLPHIELSRVIARRFNSRFCADSHIFEEPQALLSETPSLSGLDGKQKMSKSRNNAIMLRATRDEIYAAISKATTDSEKFITFDPIGRPEVSNLLTLLSLTTGKEPEHIASEIGEGGAKLLKEALVDAIDKFLTPIREKRKELEKNPDYVLKILRRGTERAREEASRTLERVIDAMNMVRL